MIKKLRIKLVIAAMASLFVVLFIIMGAVAAFNYREIVSDADATLDILAENGGKFPDSVFSNGEPEKPEEPEEKPEEPGEKPEEPGEKPEEPGEPEEGGKSAQRISAELPYESRYFTVIFDSGWDVISADTGKIASVDTEGAIDYAQSALERGNKRGFISNYRYIIYSEDEEIHIIFLHCGRELNSFRRLLYIGTGVSAAGLLAVLLLLGFVSGRVVRPFSESYEKQKRFITDAGHEIKTPLTIIAADAEVLEMDIGENEWLSDITHQTKRLAELTNSLILLARMEEEGTQTEMIEFPLSDMAEETVETFQALAMTHNKTLTANIAPMISMKGNEKSVSRLITILLDNAVKYSDDGGSILLTLERQKKQICLSVFNTAESVSRESIGHLFDRFYRADPSRNSQTGGYGLGLSIALAIVNEHKGKITASTEDEKSLLITVTFPA